MKKKINEYSKLTISLLESDNYLSNITRFRNQFGFNKNLIEKYLSRLNKTSIFRRYISGEPFPATVLKFRNEDIPYAGSNEFDNAIFWEANVLNIYADEINEFEVLRQKYVCHFLLGEYSIAKKKLNEIKEIFGYSGWVIENEMLLLSQLKGLSELKEYINSITQNEKIDPLFRILIEFSFSKINDTTNSIQFEEYIKDRFDELSTQGMELYYLDYLSFKLNITDIYPVNDYKNIFFIESDSSIIDRYLTFIDVCQQVSLNNDFYESCASAIKILNKKIKNVYINNLAYYYGVQNDLFLIEENKKVNEIINDYTCGNYTKCISESKKLISKAPYILDICEIYVKSHIKNHMMIENIPNSFINSILDSMYNILVKNNKAYESYLSLMKLIYVYSSHHWSKQIFNFLQNEFSDGEINNIKDEKLIIAKLNTPIHTAKRYKIFKYEKQKRMYLQNLEKLYGKTETNILFGLISNEKSELISEIDSLRIPMYRKEIYKARYFQKNNKFSDAITLYDEILFEKKDDLLFMTALKGKISCLLQLNKINECIKIITTEYIRNNSVYYVLPISTIIKLLDKNEIEIKDYLSLSIIYDIYIRYTNLNKFKFLDLQDTYEDFLYTQNVTKPKDLKEKFDKLDHDKIIYFLRYICIPNIMDTSPEFKSSNEIYEERIAICQLLIDLDKSNQNVYSEQIKELTAKLVINMKMAELDQSKIYVDVDGIKKSYENKMYESYTRYLALLKSQNNLNEDKKYIEIDTEDGHTILIGTNEKQRIFTKIFLDIRDLFTSSSEYGLDTYLSVNVRHGTLSGMLRKPLEVEHLVTLKNEVTNEYYDNEYWKEIYKHNTNEITKILDCLKLFSRMTDGFINLIKNKWIQIATETELIEGKVHSGLFVYYFSTEELEELENNININTTYEEFVKLIFDKLWEITEEINTTIIKKYNNVFDKLQKRVAKLNKQRKYQDLDQSITKARTEILTSINTVSNWFQRSKTFNTQDYNIQLAIDISIRMIQNIYPHKDIKITVNTVNYLFLGYTLNSFVTIFYTMFDNVIKHSFLDDNEININIAIEGNRCSFFCVNNINPELYEFKNIDKLENQLNERKGMEKVKKEGGTGFYKIVKILNTDLHCSTKIKYIK